MRLEATHTRLEPTLVCHYSACRTLASSPCPLPLLLLLLCVHSVAADEENRRPLIQTSSDRAPPQVHFGSTYLAAMFIRWRNKAETHREATRRQLALVLASQGSLVGETWQESVGLRDRGTRREIDLGTNDIEHRTRSGTLIPLCRPLSCVQPCASSPRASSTLTSAHVARRLGGGGGRLRGKDAARRVGWMMLAGRRARRRRGRLGRRGTCACISSHR